MYGPRQSGIDMNFFLWIKFRSIQIRANVMSFILLYWRKGTLSIHGFARVLQSRSMTRKGGCWKLVDSQDVGASQFTGSVSDTQWRSRWNYFQRGLGAICCLIRFFFEDWSFPGKSRFDYWFLMEIFLFYFFGWQWPGWHIQWDLVSPKTVPTGYLSQV